MRGHVGLPRNVLLSSLGDAAGAAPVGGWLAPPRAPAPPAERDSPDCCVGSFSFLSTFDLTAKKCNCNGPFARFERQIHAT